MKTILRFASGMGPEPFIWALALLWLGLSEPHLHTDFTLCPLANIGFHDCPGCGLGRAVSFALHGDFHRSFQAHWLGIPAILILTFRTISIVRNTLHFSLTQVVNLNISKRSFHA